MDRILGIKQFIILSVLFVMSSTASAVGGIEMSFKYGHVMARGLVLTDDGHAIYAEYDEAGNIVNEQVAVKNAELDGAYIISGDSYRAVANYYRQFLSDNQDGIARGARILSNEAYNSENFVTIDGKPLASGAKGALLANVKSVLVRHQKQLFIPQNDPSLVQAIINLENISANVENSTSIKSVLLDNLGNVVHASNNNIGLKVRYFEGEQSLSDKPEIGGKLYDPLPGRGVSVPVALAGGASATDADGFFAIHYMMLPCPGFAYTINSPVTVGLNFSIFNPKGEVKPVTYSLTQSGYDTCSGYSARPPGLTLTGLMAQVAVIGIEAAMSYPLLHQYAFKVDTAVINGQGYLTNGSGVIPSGPTTYSTTAPDLTPSAYINFDFDGDGSTDRAVLGVVETQTIDDVEQEVFKVDPNGTLQGIFLSGGTQNPASEDLEVNQPDFIRLADTKPDFQHQGLLESISEDDFKDTDVLVFRESNGLLVTKREGLNGREVDTGLNFGDVLAASSKMQFTMLLRGPSSAPFDYFDYGQNYSEWQSKSSINPLLHKREADHLRPQEKLRVVAINRKTGYIGTARTTYGNIVGGGEGVVSMFANLNMRPPNLKIIAEREYDVQSGLTKDQERQYLIGYEGAALASDKIIKITTQWFDHDGSPLPEGLSDFGYTGRLAKIVGVNALGKDGSALAEFSIKPGSHTQQLQVGNSPTKNEHYYVQVNGQSINENPTFDTLGAGEGPLRYRPKNYVPVLTPILDESLTWQQYLAYRQYQSDNPTETIEKPEPLYRWFYRPELQFSLYSLAVNNIYSQSAEAGSQEIDIYQDDKPVVASSDDFIRILYDLLEEEIAPLAFIGAGQELVLALGEEEISATVGEGQQLIFNNLEHLSSLDVEDFLSLRLYSNNDSANVLWEYAFEYLVLDTRWVGYDNVGEDGTIYVSADEPEVPLQAFVVGYANRENKSPINVNWRVKGQGAIGEKTQEYAEQGVFPAQLQMPTTAGSVAIVEANIIGADKPAILDRVEIIAGKPASLSVQVTGEAYIEGHKQITVAIVAKDAHGNIVADDTSVDWSVTGQSILAETDDGTTAGAASTLIKGGYQPGEYSLTVNVGDVSETVEFEIQPLVVTLSDYPTSMAANTVYPISVLVTDGEGQPAIGVKAILSVNSGKLKDSAITTDGSGLASTELHSGWSPKSQTLLTARVGLVQNTVEEINHLPIEEQHADTNNTLVVGDEVSAGYAEYERFDGARIGLAYETIAEMLVKGNKGETINLTLGSLIDPNIAPTASYYMNQIQEDLVTDEVGLHDAIASHTTLVGDSVSGVGKSFSFKPQAFLNEFDEWEPSKLVIPHDDRLQPQNSTGFRLDFKANEYNATLFSLERGVQTLLVNELGELEYRVNTDDGMKVVKSTVLVKGAWYSVGGRFANGKLELQVGDNTLYTDDSGVAQATELSYSITQHGLTLGEGLHGNLANVSFYNWDNEPLVTFEGGVLEKTVSLAENETQQLVQIVSTGQLNKSGSEEAPETLKHLRVGLKLNGSASNYVGVMSKEFYGNIAAMYAANNMPPGYPVVGNYHQSQYHPFPFIGSANAGIIDWIVDNVYDTVVGVVGFLIPYNETISFVKQLYYLAKDDDQFDMMTLALDGLAVLSVVPVAKALKPLSAALKRVFAPLKGKPFIGALGNIIAKMGDELVAGKFDTLLTMLPFLLIAGEMAFDAEARAGLIVMIDSIGSADDILAWADYLSLPADGWEGDGEPPSVDTAMNMFDLDKRQSNFEPFGMVMGSAYAAKANPIKRVDIARLTFLFSKVGKGFAKKLGKVDGAALVAAVKSTTKGMKVTDMPGLRQLVHTPLALFSAKAIGPALNRKFMQTTKNLRMSPLSLMAVVTYLEMHKQQDCAEIYPQCKPFPAQIEGELNKLYATAFASALNDNVHWVGGREIGGAFHMAMLAVKQLSYELYNVSSEKPVGMEISREVNLVTVDARGRAQLLGTSYKRRVDIVLQGSESIVDKNQSEKNIWVEVKSLKYKPNYLDSWKPWNLKGNNYSYHRQFYLDRVASTVNKLTGVENRELRRAEDFEWWLQNFKRKSRKSYQPNNMTEVAKKLRLLPSSRSDMVYGSLGFTSRDAADKAHKQSHVTSRFKQLSIKTWLLEDAKSILLDGIDPETINELINDGG